ncbi:hypothetical protein [Streptomyces sp. NBC_01314]|uniref:hypothetical protein n=1 Tax=Streptomyces sp. NBC_01314 TaxID=2903821 RepID=UPI00308A19B2|nr:hypothetical protein OG622_20190 [Streptomyces sp. NBC_01314]
MKRSGGQARAQADRPTRRARSGRTLRVAVAGLLTSATALALLSGCGLPDHRRADTGQSGGPSASAQPSIAPKAPVPSGKPLGLDAHVPVQRAVDDNDATAVSQAWAELAYGYDTKYDASPHDAVLRATRWSTKRRATIERSYRAASGPGDDWIIWARHQAWTTVTVSVELEDDAPKDSAKVAYRNLVVEGKAQGRDGWNGRGPRLNAYLKLVRSASGKAWRVDDVNVVEAVDPPSPESPSASATGTSTASSAQ